MMRSITRFIAAFAIILAAGAPAFADNDTEFGIEDDLTVLGTSGGAADPDLEVKGFTVFGATQAAPLLQIPAAPGNIFANGYVQISSGLYVAGPSTFTAYSEFQSTVTILNGNLRYGTGVAGKVMKSNGDGFVYWADDETGLAALTGTAYRIRMENAAGNSIVDSRLLQNALSTNITLTDNSSMTVTGAMGVGGDMAVGSTITVAGYSIFQSTVEFLNNTGALTNLYFNNGAANAGKVLKAASDGFLYWGTDNDSVLGMGTAYRLQMVNAAGDALENSAFLQNSAGSNITMVAGSSLTVNELMAQGDAELLAKLSVLGASTFVSSMTARGNTQFGDSTADIHALNMAPETGVGLSVNSSGTGGNYAAKFYSGGSLAAWIKKK
jgi:uncharacterized cupin superfamily protein